MSVETNEQLEFIYAYPEAERVAFEAQNKAIEFIEAGMTSGPTSVLERLGAKLIEPERVFRRVEQDQQKTAASLYKDAKRRGKPVGELIARTGFDESEIKSFINERRTNRLRVALVAGMFAISTAVVPTLSKFKAPEISVVSAFEPVKPKVPVTALMPSPDVKRPQAIQSAAPKVETPPKPKLVSLSKNGKLVRIQAQTPYLGDLLREIETKYGDHYEPETIGRYNGFKDIHDNIQSDWIKFNDCKEGSVPIQADSYAYEIAIQNGLNGAQELYDINGGQFKVTAGLCVKVK
jgi:hypothetical protein